jgi:phosphatidylinositol kinase/protein kinase (PI-3  family)
VIHIDFGFVLGIRPGGKFSFERPPFKLTQEMVDILDGPNSDLFYLYKDLIVQVRGSTGLGGLWLGRIEQGGVDGR